MQHVVFNMGEQQIDFYELTGQTAPLTDVTLRQRAWSMLRTNPKIDSLDLIEWDPKTDKPKRPENVGHPDNCQCDICIAMRREYSQRYVQCGVCGSVFSMQGDLGLDAQGVYHCGDCCRNW